jgi:hypothetical protein
VRRKWLLVTLILLRPGLAAAQESRTQPLQELFLTEVVYPQEKGEVQVTFGSLVDRSRSDLSALLPFAIEYGLTNRWQIEAGWDGYSQFHSAPIKHLQTARFSIGTKYSLMNIAHSRVHAAIGMDAEFPRTDALADDEGESGVELEPFVALAVDLGRGLTVFGSGGASFSPRQVADAARGERPDDRGTAGFGALVAFHRATMAVEYTSRSDNLPWRLDGAPLLTPSLIVHPGNQWEVGVGAPIAMRSGSHAPGIALNLVKEF